jgi:branched-subunit amino acid ABC-type transport system permease component
MIATLAVRFDVVAIGAMTGLGYAILAAGLVLVYRATKVINLAHGQIGAFAAALFIVLVHNERVPYALALPIALAAGAGIGLVVERLLVRPLVDRSRLAILVATVGVTDLLIVAQAKLPAVIGVQLHFPTPVNWTVTVGSLVLHGEHFALLMFGPVVLGLLVWFLSGSRYGLAIRGVADNREAAQLAGVSAAKVSALVWAVAGALAAVAAILTEPLSGVSLGTSGLGAALGPSLLLRALAAGLAGGMSKLWATIGAGVAIGVVEAVLYASYPKSPGIVDVVLFAFIVAMLLAAARWSRATR